MRAIAHASLDSLAFSVIDLETTGASAGQDRAIEIAVARLEHGRVTQTFATLLDPRRPIPPFITRLTGISPAMVAGRPTLDDTLPELDRAVEGTIPVAHNAPFDGSFVRAAHARAGRRDSLRWLCTLRLCRTLLPGKRSYRLADLAAGLDLPVQPCHRAESDAAATAHLLARLLALASARGMGTRDLFALGGITSGRRRGAVDEAVLRALPDGPGVYLLRDAVGEVLYVGTSARVRQRVREHARQAAAGRRARSDQPRLQRLLPDVRDVSAVATETEVEALFLESRLIKRYQPPGNALQRRERSLSFVRVDLEEPYPRLEITREPPAPEVAAFGPYRSASELAQAVGLLQAHFGLRTCAGPLRAGQAACYLFHLRKCLGPCVSAVGPASYRQAVAAAMECLAGRDQTPQQHLARRRDELAEQLRFEEAARLRDEVRALERVVGRPKRQPRVDERNLVVVSGGPRAPELQVYFIRSGRVAHQAPFQPMADADALAEALERVYAGAAAEGPASREAVDEMHLLDRWLARRRLHLQQIPVDARRPLEALDAVLRAVRA